MHSDIISVGIHVLGVSLGLECELLCLAASVLALRLALSPVHGHDGFHDLAIQIAAFSFHKAESAALGGS